MDPKPDFYLTAGGENQELTTPRACWVEERLSDPVRDDHMLVRIQPPLVGQAYGLHDKDICQLILSVHFRGASLFPVAEWPCDVYIARILDEEIVETKFLTAEQVQVIAWGRIFRTLDEATEDAKKFQR